MRNVTKSSTIVTLAALGAALIAAPRGAAQDRTRDVEVVPVKPVPPSPAPLPGLHVAQSPERRDIDLAICLDTSGSMSGLIEAAKQKLWAVVNDLALAEPTPRLRVALLTYGNSGHTQESGWVRVDVPLTEDLDLVYEKLFPLTTGGGTELVGRVLDRATRELAWSKDPLALKLAVVAGNESADQDRQVPFREACKRAIGSGVMVDAIYCGAPAHVDAPLWREIAKLTDGHYATIDHDRGTVVIETPLDERLAALSTDLNTTYLPYGEGGRRSWANQTTQDDNAKKLNKSAAASRAQTKGSALYSCGSWDLVDASKHKDFDLAAIPVATLPEAMRKMTLEQRKAHISKMGGERARIQKKIAEVGRERQAWITSEMQKAGLDESKAFDNALREALREQAMKKGFRYRDEASPPSDGPPSDGPPSDGPPSDGAAAGSSETRGN